MMAPVELDSDKIAPAMMRGRKRGTGTAERVEDEVPRAAERLDKRA